MNVVILASTLVLGQAPANLDFSKGNLAGWEGSGFAWTAATAARPAGASSADTAASRTGMIRLAFRIPAGARQIVFQAVSEVGGDNEPDGRLRVVLAGVDQVPVATSMKTSSGVWSPTSRIHIGWLGQPRTYAWEVAPFAGKLMQIVLIDQDDRPGYSLWAGGFRIIGSDPATTGDLLDADFGPRMLSLQEKHRLTPMARFDSKHFTAISNAGDAFTAERLRNCEVFHDLFLKHFKEKGFSVVPPPNRMMIAIFDSHEGFDAYFGERMPSGIAGVYDPKTNRLVLYDYATNRGLEAAKRAALKHGSAIFDPLARDRYVETIERLVGDESKEENLSTTMHECAHQISFNCGLLKRMGDVPASIAEGLATYCEATDQGDWTTLGSTNPMRVATLRRAGGNYILLTELIRDDRWRGTRNVYLGYAQSWSLFHFLMHREPAGLKKYFQTIAPRRAPESRLADFQEAFGSLSVLETRYQAYMDQLIASTAPPQIR